MKARHHKNAEGEASQRFEAVQALEVVNEWRAGFFHFTV